MNFTHLSSRTYFWIIVGVIIATALVLFSMGRLPICKCGTVLLWYGDINGAGNSQHLVDWYSLTHILHGFLYFFLFWLIFRKKDWPLGFKLLLVVMIACGWEILENSNFIINKYRLETVSHDYYGDSILNSISDVLFAVIGYLMAFKLRPWLSVIFVIAIEILLAYFVRDNLTINIIMLIHPVEAIKLWQMRL